MSRVELIVAICLVGIALALATACGSDILVGVLPVDSDVLDSDTEASDAESDVDIELDDDGDMETTDAETHPLDSDIEGDSEPMVDCEASLACLRICGTDLQCSLDCADQVCQPSEAAFSNLQECVLTTCAGACDDFAATACQDCVSTQCPLQGLACLEAEC